MTFEEDKKDKFLVEKLMAEASDILGWMIDGCILWQKEGLKEPRAINDSTKEYRTEMDLIQRWINERCLVGIGHREKSIVLFNSFLEYAKMNKEFELSNTLFGRNLSRKFTKKIYGGVTYYIGIKIKPYEKEERYEEIRVDADV
jgi:putative DNA primase/helicase